MVLVTVRHLTSRLRGLSSGVDGTSGRGLGYIRPNVTDFKIIVGMRALHPTCVVYQEEDGLGVYVYRV